VGVLEGLSPGLLALAGAILFAAYLVRGISGFGSALLAVPLLAQFLPLSFIVPWFAALDTSASLVLGRLGWQGRHIRWDEIRRLLLPSLAGILLGTLALKHLPEAWLLFPLGLFVVAFGLRALLQSADQRRISTWWAYPAGLAGGAVDALFATGGPPFVIYLTHRLHDKSELRATFSALFLLEGGARLVVLALAGFYTQAGMALAILAGLPLLALGLWAGHRIHLGISHRQMFRGIGLLLILSGLALALRAWP
jgi:uncharacterized protein